MSIDKEGFEAQKKFIPIQFYMNVSFMPKEFSYKITITIFSSFKNHLRNELLNHTIVICKWNVQATVAAGGFF